MHPSKWMKCVRTPLYHGRNLPDLCIRLSPFCETTGAAEEAICGERLLICVRHVNASTAHDFVVDYEGSRLRSFTVRVCMAFVLPQCHASRKGGDDCPYRENIRILEVDASEAQGPCWGRHMQVFGNALPLSF